MPLFDEEYGTYNADAIALDDEVTKVIRPLFDKYVKMGHRFREIAYVISSNVKMEECERRLIRNGNIAHEKNKKRQQRKGNNSENIIKVKQPKKISP